jgi:hypothetical protein
MAVTELKDIKADAGGARKSLLIDSEAARPHRKWRKPMPAPTLLDRNIARSL